MEINNEILFEFDRVINESDFDVLILFFESKKKSGGGDSVSSELMPNKRSIKIVFEDNQTKQAILERRFFKFASYLIRASSNFGYKNEKYEIDESKIILKNIDQNEDREIVKMYAENLQPENEVVEISPFNVFKNIFQVVYKDKINMHQFDKRYIKRSTLRNKVVEIITVYKLKSIILEESDRDLKNTIIDKIFSSQSLFYEEINDFILILFNNEESISDFINFLNQKNLKFDYFPNFNLIESIHKLTNNKNIILDEKEISQLNQPIKDSITLVKDIKDEKPSKLLKIKVDKTLRKEFKTMFNIMQPELNYDGFIIENKNGEFTLKEDEPLTIGLLRSTKLYDDFSSRLLQSGAQFVDTTTRIIKFKLTSSNSDKLKLFENLKDFYMNNFSSIVFEIPKSILQNPNILFNFKNFVRETSSQKKRDFCFIVDNTEIWGYGSPKSLFKQVKKLNFYSQDLIRKFKENNQIFEVQNNLKKSKKNFINETFFKNQFLTPVLNSDAFQTCDMKSINLVESENEFEYYLKIDQPPIFCLLKSEQFLKKLNTNLENLNAECIGLDTQKPLVILKYKKKFIHQNKGLKKELLDELEHFLKENFYSQVFRITKTLKEKENLYNEFTNYLNSSKQFQQTGYILIKNDFIYCYGMEKFINKKFQQLSNFLKRLSNTKENKSNLIVNAAKIHKENEVDNEEDEYEYGNESTDLKSEQANSEEEFDSTESNRIENNQISINIFQCSKLENLRSINFNDLSENKSIIINENIFPILKNSLSNCDYILDDFKKDLHELNSHCELIIVNNENCSFSNLSVLINDENSCSSQLNKQIYDLLKNYENKKLKYSSFELDINYTENNMYYLNTLIKRIKSKEFLEASDKKKKINVKNMPFVALKTNESKIFEIYGYVKDVLDYTDYIKKQQQKCIGEIVFRFKYELMLFVRASKQPLFEIFNLFGEKYFDEFRDKLLAYEAVAVRQKDNVIKVNFSEETLKKYSADYKNVKLKDLKEKVQNWRLVVKTVIENFFSNFLVDTIQLPFGETDNIKFDFDNQKLDVIWVSEKVIKITGLKEEVQYFKEELNIKYNLKNI